MHGPSPACGNEREFARIEAAFDGYFAHPLRHVVAGNAVDAGGRFLQGQSHRLCNLRLDRAPRGGQIKTHLAAGKIIRIEVAEREIGIGRGRKRAAPAVASRAWCGSRALRADAQQAALIHPGDRAAPRADGVNIEHGQCDLVPRDLTIVDRARRADRHRGLEARSAHVCSDAAIGAERLGEEQSGSGTARRPRQQGERRLPARKLRRDDAAVRLHDQENTAEARPLQASDQPIEIAVELGPDIGIERGRAHTLVETDRRQQIGRYRQISIGELAPHQLGRRLLVRRIGESVHEADRDGLDLLVLEQRDRAADVVGGERLDLSSVAVEPAADTDAQITRHQRRHVGVAVIVLTLANPASHFERIAHAARRQQRRARACVRERRIGRNGRAVDDGIDRADEIAEGAPRLQLCCKLLEAFDHRNRRILGGGKHLVDGCSRTVARYDEIGEGSADVNPDLQAHALDSSRDRRLPGPRTWRYRRQHSR